MDVGVRPSAIKARLQRGVDRAGGASCHLAPIRSIIRGHFPDRDRAAVVVHLRPVPEAPGEAGKVVAKILKTKKNDKNDISNH